MRERAETSSFRSLVSAPLRRPLRGLPRRSFERIRERERTETSSLRSLVSAPHCRRWRLRMAASPPKAAPTTKITDPAAQPHLRSARSKQEHGSRGAAASAICAKQAGARAPRRSRIAICAEQAGARIFLGAAASRGGARGPNTAFRGRNPPISVSVSCQFCRFCHLLLNVATF